MTTTTDPLALSQAISATTPPPASNQALGQDAFMKLLITQMQNQDPMNTTDDTQFVAQLAQFSSLEQSQQSAQDLASMLSFQQITQGSSLIGHTVQVVDSSSGTVQQGAVTSVQLINGKPKIGVNNNFYDLSAIQTIS